MGFFEKIWKKKNRGLFFGAILLIFFILYTLIQTISLSIQTDKFTAIAKQGLEKLYEVSVVTKGTIDENYTDAQKQTANDALDSYFNTYWGDEKTGMYYALSSVDIKENFKQYLLNPCAGNFSSVSLSETGGKVTVSANGPGYVIVSVENFTLSYEGERYDDASPFNGTTDNFSMLSGDLQAEKETETISFQMELHREKGAWKIIGFGISSNWTLF